jgi:hypothetical protein
LFVSQDVCADGERQRSGFFVSSAGGDAQQCRGQEVDDLGVDELSFGVKRYDPAENFDCVSPKRWFVPRTADELSQVSGEAAVDEIFDDLNARRIALGMEETLRLPSKKDRERLQQQRPIRAMLITQLMQRSVRKAIITEPANAAAGQRITHHPSPNVYETIAHWSRNVAVKLCTRGRISEDLDMPSAHAGNLPKSIRYLSNVHPDVMA